MTTRTIEWAPPTRRSTAFALIVALHALVIYGFLSVFVPPKVQAPVPPIIGRFIDPERPTPTTLPKPVEFTPASTGVGPIKDVVLPPIDWNPSDPSPTASSAGSDSSVGEGSSVPLSYVVTRQIDEYYPPQAILLSEEGASTLQVCVSANGLLASAPSLETSSGYARLDAAAVKWAREALRFTPAQRDGQAVPACKGFRVTFKLRT
jgi:periplasmic protein TonB